MDIERLYREDDAFQLFADNAEEQLVDIEELLMSLSSEPKQVSKDYVHQLFRYLHSLKGSSSFFPLESFTSIAHHLENLLGLVRTGHLSFSAELISLLLDGRDALAGLLTGGTSLDGEEVQLLISRCNTFLDSYLEHSVGDQNLGVYSISFADGAPIWRVSEAVLADAQKAPRGGKYIYLIKYDLYKDIEAKGKTPLRVIKEYDALTKVIESKVDIADVGDLTSDAMFSMPFYILCSTVMDPVIMGEIASTGKDNLLLLFDEKFGEKQSVTLGKVDESNAKKPVNRPFRLKHKEPVRLCLSSNLYDRLYEFLLSENMTTMPNALKDELIEAFIAPNPDSITKHLEQECQRLSRLTGHTVSLQCFFEKSDEIMQFLTFMEPQLKHMLDNAFYHGLENESVRLEKGKPESCSIFIRCAKTKECLLLEYQDDGAGIDIEMVRRVAIRKGFTTDEQLLYMRRSALCDLIVEPTLFPLGELKKEIEALNGTIDIESRTGEGLAIKVRVPLYSQD